jgi:hypothetical protein
MEKISGIRKDSDVQEKQKMSPIQEVLSPISMETWRKANWPVITYVSKKAFHNLQKDSILGKDHKQSFWLEVFNPERFFSPKRDNGYDSSKHFIFILHSFKSEDGVDSVFKAITTTEKTLLEDPENMINYQLHGKPCESRGGGSYPTHDFWDFYDNITDGKLLGKYPIPDTQWRESFVRENFT